MSAWRPNPEPPGHGGFLHPKERSVPEQPNIPNCASCNGIFGRGCLNQQSNGYQPNQPRIKLPGHRCPLNIPSNDRQARDNAILLLLFFRLLGGISGLGRFFFLLLFLNDFNFSWSDLIFRLDLLGRTGDRYNGGIRVLFSAHALREF